MTWNHRVVKRYYPASGETMYAIHEVYYTDGVPDSITVDAIAPMGESMAELQAELERMSRALAHPVLTYEDFPPHD